MIRLIPLLILCILPFSCEKEVFKEELPPLSEIIYGTWEWREEINALTHLDWEYHSNYEPFPIVEFLETDSFFLVSSLELFYNDTLELGAFDINDIDSTITLGPHTYDIFGYSKDSLDFRWFTREGPAGRKLFKVD